MVPEVRTKTHTYTVQVPVYREVEQTYQVAVPRRESVEQQYTVMVPYPVKKTATRTVCQMVPQTVTRTVCRDRGHWEDRPYVSACAPANCCDSCNRCGGAGTVTCMRRVWVPNVVQEPVECTVMRPHYSEQAYEYTVTECRPEVRTRTVQLCKYTMETRTRTVRVCSYQPEQRQREVSYTVCVPQERVQVCNVTSYRRVPEEKVVNYTVMVPEQVQREVIYQVCQMVPKTITVPVNACGSNGCGSGCGRRCCR
jgi:hypothetical protein